MRQTTGGASRGGGASGGCIQGEGSIWWLEHQDTVLQMDWNAGDKHKVWKMFKDSQATKICYMYVKQLSIRNFRDLATNV